MMVLSVPQPWAWLIVNGYKNIENRGWSTGFRGEILIHAGQRFEKQQMHEVSAVKERFPQIPLPLLTDRGPTGYQTGGIIGIARVVDCVTSSISPWFKGPFGIVLKDARPVPFMPYHSELEFFEVPDGAIRLPDARAPNLLS
jgi:hypothetical protein